MKDPRTHVVPAGSPVTVHYNDGRPPNHTRLDFPFFFNIFGKVYDVDENIVAIGNISKTVDAYEVENRYIQHRETEEV